MCLSPPFLPQGTFGGTTFIDDVPPITPDLRSPRDALGFPFFDGPFITGWRPAVSTRFAAFNTATRKQVGDGVAGRLPPPFYESVVAAVNVYRA